MKTRRTWLATFALITFVVGGCVMPVVHHVDHAAKWYEQQANAHRHGASTSDALTDGCADVGADLQHCYLCHRHFFSDLVPDLPASVYMAAEALAPPVFRGIDHSPFARRSIRAPPVPA